MQKLWKWAACLALSASGAGQALGQDEAGPSSAELAVSWISTPMSGAPASTRLLARAWVGAGAATLSERTRQERGAPLVETGARVDIRESSSRLDTFNFAMSLREIAGFEPCGAQSCPVVATREARAHQIRLAPGSEIELARFDAPGPDGPTLHVIRARRER